MSLDKTKTKETLPTPEGLGLSETPDPEGEVADEVREISEEEIIESGTNKNDRPGGPWCRFTNSVGSEARQAEWLDSWGL